MSDLLGKTAIVVGASRGIGRGIAMALADAGAKVVAVSRSAATFDRPSNGDGVVSEPADAADAATAEGLLKRYDPDLVFLVAGAIPEMGSLRDQTWETFSVNWQSDVRIAFHWLRAILTNPIRLGSRVIVFSSGAALGGSPLSGGYAGAKAMQRFMTAYAQGEAKRADLELTFTSVLPRFAPTTSVGRAAVEAYAARAGKSAEAFLQQLDYRLLTPEIAGAAMVELAKTDAATVAPSYMLTGAGLQKLAT